MYPGIFCDDELIGEVARTVSIDDLQQQSTNVTPIPFTSKQTVNEQPYASSVSSPSSFEWIWKFNQN